MTIQTIIVYLIGIAVGAWLVRAVVRGYRARKYGKCTGCDSRECPYRGDPEQDKCK